MLEKVAFKKPDNSEELNIEESLERTLGVVKKSALDFVKTHKGNEWLIPALNKSGHLDDVVAVMGNINGGQKFILEELTKKVPELKWYRGGTLKKFRDVMHAADHEYFNEEQLDTVIIDGGANGVLGRKDLALGYLNLTSRNRPVLYSVSLDGMLDGLNEKAIRLVTEHGYDLRIAEGNDRSAYLKFCKEHLNIEEIDPEKIGKQ